jgi:serine/threonine protein kinase/tetratricopeptide (TPR) repeat protein
MAIDPVRAKSLFLAASEMPDPAERAAYLERECRRDADLRGRVEALLRANDAASVAPAEPGDGTSAHVPERPGPTADYGDPTARIGAVIAGKYKLGERIGEGGMGSVWIAQQSEPVKRKVAIKLIKAGMDSKSVLARFEAERQALAVMDHPNIAKVLDGGLHDARPYFVMELVKGVPITEFCDARKLTPRERLELFVPVCQAIQHAHQKGIIHRDIKPSNVLVALYDDKPVPKVIDFGIAKATGGTLTEHTIETAFGGVVGTPEYMSPEQASLNNLDIDTRSDVYSLGVLLYELLTGSPPFARKELEKHGLLEILRVVREEEPPRPSTKLSKLSSHHAPRDEPGLVSRSETATLASVAANRGTEPKKLTGLLRSELDWVVMKALEKDRTRRYETANGFAADVLRYLAGEAVIAHPPSTTYRLRKFVRRNRPQVIAASLVFLALVAGVIGTTLGLLEARRQERLALAAADEERQAKQREAERAEGEKKAKEEAEAKRKEAETNLAFATKGNDILGSVFAGLDPKQNYATVGELSQALKDNLKKAVQDLDGAAIGDQLVVARMQNTLGQSLLGLGDHAQAIILFEKARDTCNAKLGPDHPDTLHSTNNLAAAYSAAGQRDRALPLLEETLKLWKEKLGSDHHHTLASMNNLAAAYHSAGQFDRALPLFEETLKLSKAKVGPDHPQTLTCMNNLANVYRDAGMLDRALPLFEETLKLQKAKLGPDHPETLTTMSSLAGAYREAGQHDRALSLVEDSVKLTKEKLGQDHPRTLAAMGNLAVVYRSAGQFGRALPLMEETFKLTKEKLGPDHVETLKAMGNLAGAYDSARQFDRALPLYEETLKLLKAKLGPDHPHTITAMNNLALAYRSADQLDRALALQEESLKLIKAKLGPDHPDTLKNMGNLGAAYWALKQLDKSVPLFEELLPLQVAKLGRGHPDTQSTVANLGVNYKDAGRVAEAVPLLEEAYQASKKHARLRWVCKPLFDAYVLAGKPHDAVKLLDEVVAEARSQLPKDSPQLAGHLAQICLVLLEMKRYAEAEPLLRECLAIRQTKEPNDWRTYNTQSLLGGALLGQQKYADAEPLLLKGYEGMKAREKTIPPQGAIRIPEAVDRLIGLYTATNKPDEAKKWQAERAKYPTAGTPMKETK